MNYREILFVCIVFLLIPSISCSFTETHHLSEAENYIHANKVDMAIDECEKAIYINPNNVKAYVFLGDIYSEYKNDYLNSIKYYNKAILIQETSTVLKKLMYLYFEIGDTKNALSIYKRITEIDPESTYYFPRKYIENMLIGMSMEEKVHFLEGYLSINKSDKIVIELLSGLYIKQREYNKANLILDELAVGNISLSSTIYFSLGTCNYNLGNKKEALSNFTKSRELGGYVHDEIFEILSK